MWLWAAAVTDTSLGFHLVNFIRPVTNSTLNFTFKYFFKWQVPPPSQSNITLFVCVETFLWNVPEKYRFKIEINPTLHGGIPPPPSVLGLYNLQYWSEGYQVLAQFIFYSYNVSSECSGPKVCPRKKLQCDFLDRGQNPKVQIAKFLAFIFEIRTFKAKKYWHFWKKGPNKKSV